MESLEDIFEGSDTNVIFNNFLHLYLKIVYACFTTSKINSAHRYDPWTTRGIKVSCHNKRILYMSWRGSNDTNLKLRIQKILPDINRRYKNGRKKSTMTN